MKKDNRFLENKWLHYLLMTVLIFAAYNKVLDAGFMSWDDMDYVFNTPDITGMGWEQVKNWFSTNYIGNYQPLPILTYAIDYQLGGTEPFVWHFQNVLWHIAATIMLYAFFRRMGANAYVALFVALLFALHPVQTESVSWVAARNKMMNGFFFFLTMWLYAGYVKSGNKKTLVWIYVAAVLAYLSKATAITLPFALLAVDMWMNRPLKGKTIWLEKLPLLLLAIPIGIITLQAQHEVDFLYHKENYTLLHAIVYGGYAYVRYIGSLFMPVQLSVLYPYPQEIGAVHILCTVLALGTVALGFYAWRKKWNVLAGGILFYTVNIAIVLQFIQFGEVLMADRYLYIACVGIWFPVVFYLFRWLTRKTTGIVATGVLSLIAAVFIFLTIQRNNIWLSELNFWESVTETFPESSVAQSSLGGVYLNMGRLGEAERHIDEALRNDGQNYKAWYNKGVIQMRRGDLQGALGSLNRALAIREYSKALFTRALLHQQAGNCQQALTDVVKVLEQDPYNGRAYFIKADCMERRNDLNTALDNYNKAIAYEAGEPMFYMRRGIVYAKMQRYNDAIADLSKAISMNPNAPDAYYWRGMVKYRAGQEPCGDLRTAYSKGFTEAGQMLSEVCQ